jgi:hypothetical protein
MKNTDHIVTDKSPFLTIPEARKAGRDEADQFVLELAGKTQEEKIAAISERVDPLAEELAAIDRKRAYLAAIERELQHARFVLDGIRRRPTRQRR